MLVNLEPQQVSGGTPLKNAQATRKSYGKDDLEPSGNGRLENSDMIPNPKGD